MQTGLDRAYGDALDAYVKRGGEEELSIAYELGRRALREGLGLVEMAALHHNVFNALLLSAPDMARGQMANAAADFFRELLSPFEMTFRGYREANEALSRLNETLARQKQEVETVNRELESFSYSVSHDLRAPLRSIDGFSHALLDDCSEKLDAQGRSYLQRIRASTQRMGQLIDDLLSLSRVTRADLRRVRVDLSSAVREIAERLQATQPSRRAEFRIKEGVSVKADGPLVAIMLENLVGNAWKFTSKRESTRIEFGEQQQAGATVYFLRDNGAGFDMAFVGKLFGVFQRLHSFSEFEGTGIGLATVERIVHRHGGKVWGEGEVNRGATFYFTLGSEA